MPADWHAFRAGMRLLRVWRVAPAARDASRWHARRAMPPARGDHAVTASGRVAGNGRNIVAIRQAPTPIANEPT